MARKHLVGRFTRSLCCALFLLALAACASVEVDRTPVATMHPATAEAQALARAHAGLPGPARAGNAARIEALLAQLDDASLARDAGALAVGDPLYNFAGRALLNRGLSLPRPFDRGEWNFDAAGRPPADRDGYRPPMRVALLLPLTGGQAAAATAVRDGFLTGYYGEGRRRPEVRFYDSASGANAAYARAGSRMPPAGNASFSLSPEDEGISLAQYLIDRGARRVLIASGGEDAQRRSAGAAKAQLERRGVQATEEMTGAQGVDAVLLAMKAPQARALLARLAAAGVVVATRVATAQITSGTGKAGEDAALDGIVFPSEAWAARNVAGLPAQARAAERLGTAKGPAARLFAFGFDAWLLTAYLERLALSANADIAGATGQLSLDGFGNVLRRPSWSRFAGGVPVPLDDGGR